MTRTSTLGRLGRAHSDDSDELTRTTRTSSLGRLGRPVSDSEDLYLVYGPGPASLFLCAVWCRTPCRVCIASCAARRRAADAWTRHLQPPHLPLPPPVPPARPRPTVSAFIIETLQHGPFAPGGTAPRTASGRCVRSRRLLRTCGSAVSAAAAPKMCR